MKTLTPKPYTSLTLSNREKDREYMLGKILSYKTTNLPRKVDKPLILYGAGNMGKMAREFFEYINLPFLYIVDIYADKHKKGKEWKNIKIIKPEDVSEKDKKKALLVVCLATSPLVDIKDKLVKAGWKDIAFFYDVSQSYNKKHPLNNGWFIEKLDKKDKENIKKIFYALDDNRSREHYLQFLAWRRMRIELLSKDLSIDNDNRFFIPEILKVLRGNEVFIDCGAHKGFVIEKFIKVTLGKYKSIYAIEPDEKSLKILKDNLKKYSNIKIIKYALTDNKGTEKFYSGFDFASKLDKKGNRKIQTIKLDSLKLSPTFIKMHLEGGELKALKGSINTLKKHRPIIVTTLYHNSDGIYKIQNLLMTLENYIHYFRTHSYAGTGAVLYSIPKERNE